MLESTFSRHLTELNIGRLKASTDDPRVADVIGPRGGHLTKWYLAGKAVQ